MKNLLIFAFAALLCVSCGGRQNAKAGADSPVSAEPITGYQVPQIPSILTDPMSQAEYLLEHFWEKFDFTDTTNIDTPDYTEQAFAFYVQVLHNMTYEMGDASIGETFVRASANKEMFLHFAELAEKYLYDPNSPLRDEEYYITVLESVLANPELDEWERVRPQEQLRMAQKNRAGAPAADFRFTLESGASGTLYGLKAQYTLLFINNPGCTACKQIMQEIMEAPFLTHLIEAGEVVVLAVYPDEDLAEWRKFAPNMPEGWINSYDRELKIKNEELYDLKAVPTLYLLDKDKKVVLKDVVSVGLIEETLFHTVQ